MVTLRLEPAGQLGAEAQDVFFGERALAKPLGERRAGDELQDEKVDPVLGVEVEQGGDVGVGESGEGVSLLAEAGAGPLIGQRALREDLQGDVAVELEVVGAVDLTHASRPEAFDDAVVGERAADRSALLRSSWTKLGASLARSGRGGAAKR